MEGLVQASGFILFLFFKVHFGSHVDYRGQKRKQGNWREVNSFQ